MWGLPPIWWSPRTALAAVGYDLLTARLPWRDSGGFALAQFLDQGEHFLPGEDAFAFQQLHQRRGLPHGGEGQLFEGHEVVGLEGFSREVYGSNSHSPLEDLPNHAPFLVEEYGLPKAVPPALDLYEVSQERCCRGWRGAMAPARVPLLQALAGYPRSEWTYFP